MVTPPPPLGTTPRSPSFASTPLGAKIDKEAAWILAGRNRMQFNEGRAWNALASTAAARTAKERAGEKRPRGRSGCCLPPLPMAVAPLPKKEVAPALPGSREGKHIIDDEARLIPLVGYPFAGLHWVIPRGPKG